MSRRLEHSLASTQRIARIGSWHRNIAAKSLWWSDEVYRILGEVPNSINASFDTFLERVHPEDRSLARTIDMDWYERAIDGVTFRIVRSTGEIRTVRARRHAIFGGNRSMIRLTCTIQDITEQRKIESQLHQSQKLASVGQLTVGIAHDFNNLMMVVSGFLHLLRDDAKNQNFSAEFIDDASKAIERGSKLTQRLLSFSRPHTVEIEAIDLRALIRHMVPILSRSLGANIDIEVVDGHDLWRCETDVNQLENVLLNLAINARDAMQEGGRLRIETDNLALDDDSALVYSDTKPGQYVLLSVSDTGHGMPREVIAKAFDTFYTTKKQGTGSGLGLSTVRSYVEKANGYIHIESVENEGTCVKIFLPRTTRATDGFHRAKKYC